MNISKGLIIKTVLGAGAVAGAVVFAPVVVPVAAGAAASAGTAIASTAVGSAVIGGATAATTAIASSAVGTAVGSGLAAVGTAVGSAAGAVGIGSVATVAGTSAGATAVGVISTSAAVGVGGATSGVAKMNKASHIVKDAKSSYEETRLKFDSYDADTKITLENLGTLKVSVWNQFSQFEEEFKKIQNLEFIFDKKLDKYPPLDKNKLEDIHVLALSARSVMKDGVISLTSGELIGAAASTGITSVATASTGTAIASLHGAAATNASLAALGGGSLSSGGLGMAGGAVVSNMLTFAPMAAIGGLFLSSHGSKSLKSAKETLEESNKLVEDMNSAIIKLIQLQNLSNTLSRTIRRYSKILNNFIEKIKALTSNDCDARNYSEDQVRMLYAAIRTNEILVALTKEPLFNPVEEGKVPTPQVTKISALIKDCETQWEPYRDIEK